MTVRGVIFLFLVSLVPFALPAQPQANSAGLTSTDFAPATRQSSSPSLSGNNRFCAWISVPRAIPSAKDAARSSAAEDSA